MAGYVIKTDDYEIQYEDAGNIFLTTGATKEVVFKLPKPALGMYCTIINTAEVDVKVWCDAPGSLRNLSNKQGMGPSSCCVSPGFGDVLFVFSDEEKWFVNWIKERGNQ